LLTSPTEGITLPEDLLASTTDEMIRQYENVEEAVRESEKMHREVFENADSIIIKMDSEGRPFSTNMLRSASDTQQKKSLARTSRYFCLGERAAEET
jgi:hypothetical protein